ncbi:MAG: PQQ-binding-like beta-propeller repeat protein, partial [Candidatus Aenigmatarchaeota archaeon]
LLTNSGNELWSYSASGDVYALSIANLSFYEGDEVVAGTSDGYVYLINSSGSLVWSLSIGNTIYDLEAKNVILTNQYDEIAVASGDNKLYLLNSSGFKLWNFSGSSAFKGVGIGNLSNDEGDEIAAGTGDGNLYVLNSSGFSKHSCSLGIGINDVSSGNVILTNQYDEIAIAGNNGTVFLLDSNCNFLWSFSTQAYVDTVIIADVTSDPGSEVIAGSHDDRVYAINSSGSLVWSYLTQNDVRGIAVGNLTSDPGDEVVAGTNIPADYTLYVLNFEYYPTNFSLDVGDDKEIEWYYSGKFRGKASISNNSAFQRYLEGCEPDSRGNCDVPLIFHSDFAGILNITSIYLEFEYNFSEIVSSSVIDAWSRVIDIRVNESIGNQSVNISFIKNPALDLLIKYIRVNESATKCDFNNYTYDVITIEGKKYCDVSSLNYLVSSSGYLSPILLWDDSMSTGIPIIMNESEGKIVEEFWKKNITIFSTTSQIFYNITANTSIDENFVIAPHPKLKVFWNDSWEDVTPSQPSSDCNSTNPSYYKITIGEDNFFVCMQDTNSNGIEDFFVWKQPHSSITLYEVIGSGNYPPQIFNVKVT